MSETKNFFENIGYMTIQTASTETDVTIEDLYQAFSARMREERMQEKGIFEIFKEEPSDG